MDTETETYLKREIQGRAFKNARKMQEEVLAPDGNSIAWFFDFRELLFDKTFLQTVSKCFWDIVPQSPLQVGGLESAALPLIAGIVLKGNGASGFYIRKSRKKKMGMKQIEGTLTDAPVVLVDDLINSGDSFKRQVEVLEREGKKVAAIFSIVRFRPEEEYSYFSKKGIKIYSLFTIDEFGLSLPKQHKHITLSASWHIGSRRPHLFEVRERSQPILQSGRIYRALDSGFVECISAETGHEIWRRKVVFFPNPSKQTFTDVTLSGEHLYVGTARGVVAVLRADNGRLVRVRSIADICMTNLVMTPHGLVVGVYGGRTQKPYEVVCVDPLTLNVKWKTVLQEAPTSVCYTGKMILCGDSGGNLSLFRADTGRVYWQFPQGEGAIGKLTLRDNHTVAFGTEAGAFILFDFYRKKKILNLKIGEWLISAPFFDGERAYIAGLDGNLYCVDLAARVLKWKQETKGRFFSSPRLCFGHICVGNNEGKLYFFEPLTGMVRGSYMVTERITGHVLTETGSECYVPTFAEEIYALAIVSEE